jgi:hypothetical protein
MDPVFEPTLGHIGTCELCGHHREDLGLLGNQLLCEECREYTKMNLEIVIE